MEEIREIKLEDQNYPELLKKIGNPPKILYFVGEIRKQEPCFAVVGTRRCSDYGREATLDITGKLADAGLTIVSGLAPGIDTIAHQVCVEKKKRTIAVLGTGLDEKSIYPKQNIGLAKEILKNGGCLVSELPPGTPGSKFTFPNRNRIVSGLSKGVLVVEAKEKSGSLITANYAFSQKKTVFAVPGPIHASNSAGPHKLIKMGAKLADSADDILQELDLPVFGKQGNMNIPDNREEILILGILKENRLHIDKIIEQTRLPATTVASTLAILEIKEMVRNLGGNIYALIR
jgi:DNA processing protein